MSAVDRFVACARDRLGGRYVWGTAGPGSWDCSGLVADAYHCATGETITRSSHEQVKLGVPVHVDELRPGDLVFWGRADHVGIYEGNGQVLNALNEQRGVVRTPLGGQYGLPFLGARRLFMEGASHAGEPTGKPSEVAGRHDGEPGPSPGLSTKRERDRDRQRRREKDRQRRGGRKGRR